MTIVLTQGNLPPNPTETAFDEQVKADTQDKLILMSHELWSNAGQSLGGIWYTYSPFVVTNTSFTQTPFNTTLPLFRYCPMLNVGTIVNKDGACFLTFDAFLENAEMKVYVFDQDYGFSISDTLTPTDGTPQWTTGEIIITAANMTAYGFNWWMYIEIRRLTFDTQGFLHHFGAKCLYRDPTDLPGQ